MINSERCRSDTIALKTGSKTYDVSYLPSAIKTMEPLEGGYIAKNKYDPFSMHQHVFFARRYCILFCSRFDKKSFYLLMAFLRG